MIDLENIKWEQWALAFAIISIIFMLIIFVLGIMLTIKEKNK